jgi:hypothetical protein
MTIVTNPNPDPHGGGSKFASVLLQLRQTIPKPHNTPELKAIISKGLRIAQETDEEYQKYGNFPRLRVYLIYQITFELWSYQHQMLLKNIDRVRDPKLEDYNLVDSHQELAIKIFDTFANIANIENPNPGEIRDDFLAGWAATIQELGSMFGYLPKPMLDWNIQTISGNKLYAIIATFCFVVALLIATLILMG